MFKDKIPFRTDEVEGTENIMLIDDDVSEIRFNHVTREISVVFAPEEPEISYDDMSWRKIKKMVTAEGGEWTDKKRGIKFLMSKEV